MWGMLFPSMFFSFFVSRHKLILTLCCSRFHHLSEGVEDTCRMHSNLKNRSQKGNIDKMLNMLSQFSSVQSLSHVPEWPNGLQHSRPPCPSPISGVYSNSCPLSRWCHPTISSSVVPYSSCLQSFPASGSFQMTQLFTSGGQSIGVSASTSVIPMNIQDWCL